MSISIEILNDSQAEAYEALLLSDEASLLYASYKFQVFLKRILSDSQPFYLTTWQDGQLVGALPTFVRYNVKHGNVLNSLPFYGSNGGIIISPTIPDKTVVKHALLDAFHELAQVQKVVVSTLITNPLDRERAFYEAQLPYQWRDERIGQITLLPEGDLDNAALQERLMTCFHKKTRNSIRKAQKSGVHVFHSDSIESLHALAILHQQNITAIGGRAKPWEVFSAIHEIFTYDQDYRLYVAERDGEFIAGLLVFFYNRTAEYYTPATLESARIYQPMSLLVFEAMQEACRRGCQYWNWGGTWLSQTGVYQFKSRFGAQDIGYHYYIREYVSPNPLRRLSSAQILAEYPYFYVLPFQVLGDS